MTSPQEQSIGISRDEFSLRIAAALGSRGGQKPVPPRLPISLIRRVRTGRNAVDRFCTEARDAGMAVTRTKESEAADVITNLLEGVDANAVLIGCAESWAHSLARKAVRDTGLETPDSRMLTREQLFQIRVSVTDVHAAVAETGSILMTSHAARPRLAHLAPSLHIALVKADQIVPDLYDLLADDAWSDIVSRSAYTALVTGPSKTADIEGVLITGVHGPGAVHAVVIESS